jgi:hypothetical protein
VGGMVDLRGRRRVVAAVGALVVLAALVMLAKAAERPPDPMPASAPKTEFSAERAWEGIHAGDWLVKLLLMSVILGMWPKGGRESKGIR